MIFVEVLERRGDQGLIMPRHGWMDSPLRFPSTFE